MKLKVFASLRDGFQTLHLVSKSESTHSVNSFCTLKRNGTACQTKWRKIHRKSNHAPIPLDQSTGGDHKDSTVRRRVRPQSTHRKFHNQKFSRWTIPSRSIRSRAPRRSKCHFPPCFKRRKNCRESAPPRKKIPIRNGLAGHPRHKTKRAPRAPGFR